MKSILLIEDNIDMSENTAEILEMAEYMVITAEDGEIGIRLAALCQPDLIISDITMPVMDGFDVLENIRKSITVRNTPFLFLTARTENENRKIGMDLGATAYLTKPFDGDELLKVISTII